MNDQIFETVVTTVAADGTPHVAPMGVRYQGERIVLMPFKPSTTHDNIVATNHAVLNIVTDTRVFAGCVTGRKQWPTLPAERVPAILEGWLLGQAGGGATADVLYGAVNPSAKLTETMTK